MDMKFDLQRFRDAEDVRYRGRRRISGNWGRVWINGSLVWELSAFELKMTANRETVIIGQSEDSKITSLAGEGSITIKMVFDRGFNELLENWKAGHDERVQLVGLLADPDSPGGQHMRVIVENVWINDIDLLSFTKGEVVERTISIGYTPEDVYYSETILSD